MSDEENGNRNQENDPQIHFRKRVRYFRIKNIVITLCFILIAVISGAISAKVIIQKTFSKENVLNNIKQNYEMNRDYLQKRFSEAIEKASYSLVSISNEANKLSYNTYSEENVTGIAIRKEGYIITSYARVKNFKDIYVNVTAPGIKPTKGDLVAYDKAADIALIKIDYDNLVPIEIEEYNNYKEGEFIVSIGNTMSDSYVGISLPGVITSMNDNVKDNEGNVYSIVQTNTVLNKFNDGGVICNMDGKLIAMNSKFIDDDKFGDDALSFSISGNEISHIVERLIGNTDILGINRGIALSEKQENVKGVYVATVKAGGIADKAGITPTDIIIDISGVEVDKPEDIYKLVKDKNPGDIVKGTILHDGIETNIELIME